MKTSEIKPILDELIEETGQEINIRDLLNDLEDEIGRKLKKREHVELKKYIIDCCQGSDSESDLDQPPIQKKPEKVSQPKSSNKSSRSSNSGLADSSASEGDFSAGSSYSSEESEPETPEERKRRLRAEKKAQREAEKQKTILASTYYVVYTPKSLLVLGKTTEVKSAIKAIGGRWMSGRQVQGWIFKREKAAELESYGCELRTNKLPDGSETDLTMKEVLDKYPTPDNQLFANELTKLLVRYGKLDSRETPDLKKLCDTVSEVLGQK